MMLPSQVISARVYFSSCSRNPPSRGERCGGSARQQLRRGQKKERVETENLLCRLWSLVLLSPFLNNPTFTLSPVKAHSEASLGGVRVPLTDPRATPKLWWLRSAWERGPWLFFLPSSRTLGRVTVRAAWPTFWVSSPRDVRVLAFPVHKRRTVSRANLGDKRLQDDACFVWPLLPRMRQYFFLFFPPALFFLKGDLRVLLLCT